MTGAPGAICLAQAYALKGDAANVRTLCRGGEEGLRGAASCSSRMRERPMSTSASRSRTWVKRMRRSARASVARRCTPVEGCRGGPYIQHQLVRIYILVGEPEKALDQLEPLLNIPYYLSPGWLKIDPNFDPLRKNPRFQKLVAGAK